MDAQFQLSNPTLTTQCAAVAANGIWDELSRQLASSGQSLRSTIRAALNSANLDGKRCQELAVTARRQRQIVCFEAEQRSGQA